ncbi:MAG: YcxB family protein [Clostridiaceae bacterium]
MVYKEALFTLKYIFPFVYYLVKTIKTGYGVWFFLAGFIPNVLLISIMYKGIMQKKFKKEAKHKIYRYLFSSDDNGIEFATCYLKVRFNWPSVIGIAETKKYIHLYNDLNQDIFIPKRAFDSEDEKNKFMEQLNNCSTNIINWSTLIRKIIYRVKQK